MKKKLYLASNSSSRKILMNLANIEFEVIAQDADESIVDRNQPIDRLVKNIAQFKMQHVQIPQGQSEGDICYVLTADTMNLTARGNVLGKPKSRDEAVEMLKESREGNITASGFCIRKLEWKKDSWHIMQEIVDSAQALCVMDVPDHFIDVYLNTTPYDSLSGAIGVELAPQYCKKIEGSYTAIVGLPMYEVREALFQLGFYN